MQSTAVEFSKELVKKLRNAPLCENSTYLHYDIVLGNKDGKAVIEADKYDLIIDKGTLDCLFCDENSMIGNVIRGLRECYRVLKEGGMMISVSHGKPKFRKYLMRNKLVPFRVAYDVMIRGTGGTA